MMTTPTPMRLYLMQVATLPQLNIPIVCYLVQTSDGKNLLIDSGLPENGKLPSTKANSSRPATLLLDEGLAHIQIC